MKFLNKNTKSLLAGALVMASAAAGLSSCNAIYDDLEPCPQGLVLRFVYDYNMEFANAFPSQVHCLNLYVYDEQGNYVTTRTVTDRELLSDESWRMTIDLPEGNYRLLAYGGIACDESSFSFTSSPTETSLQNIELKLDPQNITSPRGTLLHNLFYGYLDVVVEQSKLDYNYYTVNMLRDTNDIRVILQEMNGEPVSNKDFEFSIIADNTLMAWNNDLIATTPTTFCPWSEGQATTGLLPDGSEVKVGYAEFSIPRLVENISARGTQPASPRLRICRRSDGSEVLDIPLINYLSLYKSDRYSKMPLQEFLDRENSYSMIFFLDSHWKWINTQIVVNDWTVRINDATPTN